MLSSVAKVAGTVGATAAVPISVLCWVQLGQAGRLQKEYGDLKGLWQQAENDKSTAKDNLRKAERDVAKLRTFITRRLRKAHTNVVLVEQLQAQLAAAEVSLAAQQQQVCGLEMLVDRLLHDVSSGQQQLQDTQQQLQDVEEHREELEATATSQFSSLTHLRLKLQQSEDDSSKARLELLDSADAYTRLREQKTTLVGHNKQLQDLAACKDTTINELTIKLSTMTQQAQAAEESASVKAAAHHCQLQALAHELQATVADAEASSDKLQSVIATQSALIAQLSSQLQQSQARAIRAKGTAAAHQQELGQLAASHKLEVAGLTGQVQQQQQELTQLKAALASTSTHARRSSSSSGCSTESLPEAGLLSSSCCSSSSSLFAEVETPLFLETPSVVFSPPAGPSCCVEEAEVNLTDNYYPTSWQQVLGVSAEDETPEQPAVSTAGQQQQQQDVSNASTSETPLPHKAGLSNPPGCNYCCYNALSQALRVHEGVVQGINQLPDRSIDYVVEQQLGPWREMTAAEAAFQPGDGRIVVDPSLQCGALSIASGSGANEMQDVGDVHNTLLDSLAASQGAGLYLGSRGAVADTQFGSLVCQRVSCSGCGKTTHCIDPRWEHQVMFSTSELSQTAAKCPGASQEQLLARVLREHKACDVDQGGCGRRMAVQKQLLSGPEVLVLRPTWEQQVTGQDIRDTLAHLPHHIDLNKLFDASQVPASQTLYWLTSIVVYYGQHYHTFIFCEELGQWISIDDSNVKVVGQQGSWGEVVDKCVAGRLQPGLVTYQRVDELELMRLQSLQQQQQVLLQQEKEGQGLSGGAGEGVSGTQQAGGSSGVQQAVLSKSQKKKAAAGEEEGGTAGGTPLSMGCYGFGVVWRSVQGPQVHQLCDTAGPCGQGVLAVQAGRGGVCMAL